MKIAIAACLKFALAFAPLSNAAEEAEHHLSQWRLGPVLFGESVSAQNMKGKVVVIENWGSRCPRCVARLPELSKLDRRQRRNGLLLIGAESQGNPKSHIETLVKENKLGYTITSGADGPIRILEVPHAFVFDVKGKLIFSGSPDHDDCEKIIKRALKDVPENEEDTALAGNLFGTRTWTNAEGKEIHAAVKTASWDMVTFVMFGGRVVTYPMSKLSEFSRELIAGKLIPRKQD